MLHDDCTKLQVAGPQQQKFDGVAPIADPPGSRNGYIHLAGDFSYAAQGHRLNGRARNTSDAGLTINLRQRCIVVDVHTNDSLDCVYGTHSIRSAPLNGSCSRCDIGNLRR